MSLFFIIDFFIRFGMGGTDSKSQKQSVQNQSQQLQIPTDPLINRLRKAFRLQSPENNPKLTHSFLFGGFYQQINSFNASKVSPNNSPFCYTVIKDLSKKSQEILTCALISPLLALAPGKSISGENGYIYHKQLVLQCCRNKTWVQRVVTKMVSIQDSKLVLLFLQEPIWELGWSGITFLDNSSQMNDLAMFRILYQTQIQQNKKKAQNKVIQIISRVYFKDLGVFKGKALKSQQSLVFVIKQRKTYILGVQNDEQCSFFDTYTLEQMRIKVDLFLTLQKEREYLKMIDLEQMEIQTNW